MKLVHDSITCLLHLLLLAELLVPASPRPAPTPSLCGKFRSMSFLLEKLMDSSKELHQLDDSDQLLDSVDHTLHHLPHVQQAAAQWSSLQVNESLSQLCLLSQSWRLHVDWLRTERDRFSLPSQAAGDASAQLLLLSNVLNTTLHQMGGVAPRPPGPSLPAVSSSFDLLLFSVEVSEKLLVFCRWSKRVLRSLQRLSLCPRR